MESGTEQGKKTRRKKPIVNDARYQHAIEVGLKTRFEPGKSGNPAGRPPGSLNHETKLERIAIQIGESITRVERKRGESLLDHFIERAFDNDAVLVAAMKKIMPDLIKKDGEADRETNILYISVPTNYDLEKLPPRMKELVKLGILVPKSFTPRLEVNEVHANGSNGNGKHVE